MENEIITLDDAPTNDTAIEDTEESELSTQLPLSKIKKISKLVPSLNMITAEAVKAITFASEIYVELLAKAAFQSASEDGRKTVQLKDINRAMKRDWLFSILEDAIDDWPDFLTKSKNAADNTSFIPKPVDDQNMDSGQNNDQDIAEVNEPFHAMNNEEEPTIHENTSQELVGLEEMLAIEKNLSTNERDIMDIEDF